MLSLMAKKTNAAGSAMTHVFQDAWGNRLASWNTGRWVGGGEFWGRCRVPGGRRQRLGARISCRRVTTG